MTFKVVLAGAVTRSGRYTSDKYGRVLKMTPEAVAPLASGDDGSLAPLAPAPTSAVTTAAKAAVAAAVALSKAVSAVVDADELLTRAVVEAVLGDISVPVSFMGVAMAAGRTAAGAALAAQMTRDDACIRCMHSAANAAVRDVMKAVESFAGISI